jgi:hypothetical protein
MPADSASALGATSGLGFIQNSSQASSAPAQGSGDAPAGTNPPNGSAKPKNLQTESRLMLIRSVDGEFAKAVLPLPRGKEGFRFLVGQPIDSHTLGVATSVRGMAANKGDTVQVTNIEFRAKEIVVQLNGGAKKKFHLREHLEVGVGNTTQPVGSSSHAGEGLGSILILDYGRPVPDLSADQLKHDLSQLLDFSGQVSATVNWVDTLAPEFKQGIEDHQAVVGMDQEMVIAAMGRPERKVRERTAEGDETEDWIYGDPPAKTTFVTFSSGKVIRVKEFN